MVLTFYQILRAKCALLHLLYTVRSNPELKKKIEQKMGFIKKMESKHTFTNLKLHEIMLTAYIYDLATFHYRGQSLNISIGSLREGSPTISHGGRRRKRYRGGVISQKNLNLLSQTAKKVAKATGPSSFTLLDDLLSDKKEEEEGAKPKTDSSRRHFAKAAQVISRKAVSTATEQVVKQLSNSQHHAVATIARAAKEHLTQRAAIPMLEYYHIDSTDVPVNYGLKNSSVISINGRSYYAPSDRTIRKAESGTSSELDFILQILKIMHKNMEEANKGKVKVSESDLPKSCYSSKYAGGGSGPGDLTSTPTTLVLNILKNRLSRHENPTDIAIVKLLAARDEPPDTDEHGENSMDDVHYKNEEDIAIRADDALLSPRVHQTTPIVLSVKKIADFANNFQKTLSKKPRSTSAPTPDSFYAVIHRESREMYGIIKNIPTENIVMASDAGMFKTVRYAVKYIVSSVLDLNSKCIDDVAKQHATLDVDTKTTPPSMISNIGKSIKRTLTGAASVSARHTMKIFLKKPEPIFLTELANVLLRKAAYELGTTVPNDTKTCKRAHHFLMHYKILKKKGSLYTFSSGQIPESIQRLENMVHYTLKMYGCLLYVMNTCVTFLKKQTESPTVDILVTISQCTDVLLLEVQDIEGKLKDTAGKLKDE
jgi:hypothetical protein